jgi:hypothetical protein
MVASSWQKYLAREFIISQKVPFREFIIRSGKRVQSIIKLSGANVKAYVGTDTDAQYIAFEEDRQKTKVVQMVLLLGQSEFLYKRSAGCMNQPCL